MSRLEDLIRRPTTPEEEEALAERLKEYVLLKLAMNRGKKVHWDHLSTSYLSSRILDEHEELEEAIAAGHTPYVVWKEAADVAIFAAMTADRYEKRCVGEG